MTDFEKWLRTACFQKPAPEAYDLARMAWDEAYKQGVQNGIDAALDRSEFIRSSSPSELRH